MLSGHTYWTSSGALTHDQKLLVESGYKTARIVLFTYLARYRYMTPFKDDLLQEAYTGLIRAAKHYDPDRGCSFSAYCSDWVRAQITQSAPMYLHSVHVPAGADTAYRPTNVPHDEFVAEAYQDPRDGEERIGVSDMAGEIQEKLTRRVGKRDSDIWWNTVVLGAKASDETRRNGMSRQRVSQVIKKTSRVFTKMTTGMRNEVSA